VSVRSRTDGRNRVDIGTGRGGLRGERVRTETCPLFDERSDDVWPGCLVFIELGGGDARRDRRGLERGLRGERVRTQTCPLF
jgi:hypothetical protein